MFHYSQGHAIDLIIIDDFREGMALRSLLESFGVQVRVHTIGNVQHFLSLFEDPRLLHLIVIISCHGNEQGLLLPELSPEIEQKMPFHRVLKAQDIQATLSFNQHCILSTGCCLGNKDFAEAFISRGAGVYIGAEGYIEASAVPIFMITFFYWHFIKKMTIKAAFDQAKNIDVETQKFQLFLRNP